MMRRNGISPMERLALHAETLGLEVVWMRQPYPSTGEPGIIAVIEPGMSAPFADQAEQIRTIIQRGQVAHERLA